MKKSTSDDDDLGAKEISSKVSILWLVSVSFLLKQTILLYLYLQLKKFNDEIIHRSFYSYNFELW